MKLNYKKIGEGRALVILHGLFGSLDNWQTLGKKFGEQYAVYLLDLRNHGHSPHSDDWTYDLMCDDLMEFLNDNNLDKIYLLGHSLGGKVAMQFALKYPERVDKLIVADIAPKYYPPHHEQVLAAMNAVNLEIVKSRKEAEEILANNKMDVGTRQFLLKNIFWKDESNTTLAWLFNLKVIERNIQIVGSELLVGKTNSLPCLFLKGAKSNYILEEDLGNARTFFPNATLQTIENAGHWLHADQPVLFYEEAIRFLEGK